jgi:hypothetical protein
MPIADGAQLGGRPPPGDCPSACWRLAWIAGNPYGRRRRAGGPGPPWSRSGRPSPTPQHRQPGTQRGLDPGPRSYRSASAQTACRPSPKTHSAWASPAMAPRYGPGTGCRSTPGVIPPTPSLRGVNRCQQRRQLRPLLVGDLESSLHGRLLPHHLYPTQTHQRSEKHALGELWCQGRGYSDAGLPAIAFDRPPQLAFQAVV